MQHTPGKSLWIGEGENVDHFPIHVLPQMSTFCKGSKMLLGSAYATRKNWLVRAVISKWIKHTFNQFGWLKQSKNLFRL